MESKESDTSLNTSDVKSAIENEEEDEVVTMVDVLEQECNEEFNANVLLGGVDDKICTYSQGYLPRQPLYACMTCKKDKPAGVCLGCSYKCHEGHELVELFTKRNFRCDCGNSSFGDKKCSLFAVKDEDNANNQYNHNFSGVYCTCERPYPDEEDTENDVMVQCVICEDWYHTKHLKSKNPLNLENDELVCHICMDKMPFLKDYIGVDTQVSPDDSCVRPPRVDGNAEAGAFIWPSGWREKICRCPACVQLYMDHKVSFLTDTSDTMHCYESKSLQQSTESRYERGMRALNDLDHVRRIEAIQSYNDMKSALMEHLNTFKESNRVVSEQDIREFFSNMAAKRPRLYDAVPSSCR